MSPKPATERVRAASGTSRVHFHFCARPISEYMRLHWRRASKLDPYRAFITETLLERFPKR